MVAYVHIEYYQFSGELKEGGGGESTPESIKKEHSMLGITNNTYLKNLKKHVIEFITFNLISLSIEDIGQTHK